MITNNNDIENISNTDIQSTLTINTEPDILNCLELPEADELVDIVEKFFWEYTGNFVLNDLFNGQLFAYLFDDKVLFCKEKKEWLAYNGIRWIENADNYVRNLIFRLAEAVDIYISSITQDTNDPLYQGARNWQKARTHNAVYNVASVLMPVSFDSFDANPMLLNCRNGTIELLNDSYRFREHRAKDYLTKCANADYDATADCTFFNDICESIMRVERPSQTIPDIIGETREKAEYLQRMVGYSLTGRAKEECFFILYGDGRNGKGVFVHSLTTVLGDYAVTAMPNTFAKGQSARSGAASENVARLAGCRFINVPEPEKCFKLNEAFIKAVTGEDTITARFLYQGSFEFQMNGKIVMSTNYLPEITDKTVFDSGRIIMIPFEHHFTEDEQDKGLKELLITEDSKSAILKWSLEGYQKQCVRSVKDFPKSIKEAIDTYKAKTINVQQFISEEMVELQPGKYHCTTTEAYDSYKEWCDDNNLHAESQEEFNEEVSKIADIKRKTLPDHSKKKFIIGLDLKVHKMCENENNIDRHSFYGCYSLDTVDRGSTNFSKNAVPLASNE